MSPSTGPPIRLEMKSARVAQPSWRRYYVAPSYRTGATPARLGAASAGRDPRRRRRLAALPDPGADRTASRFRLSADYSPTALGMTDLRAVRDPETRHLGRRSGKGDRPRIAPARRARRRARRGAARRAAHAGGFRLCPRQPGRAGQYRRRRTGDRSHARRCRRLARPDRRGDRRPRCSTPRAPCWSSAIPRPASCCRSARHEAPGRRLRAVRSAPLLTRRGVAGLARRCRSSGWSATAGSRPGWSRTIRCRWSVCALRFPAAPRSTRPAGTAPPRWSPGCSTKAPALTTPSPITGKLDDLAGELRFAAGHDEFEGSLKVLKQNLAEAAESAAPGPDRAAFRAPMRSSACGPRRWRCWRARRATRARLAGRLWMRDAFEDHPYGRDSAGSPVTRRGDHPR